MASNLLNNRYAVLEKLDEGTFGEVYKCWDHRDHKEMAFKKIDITLSIKEVQAYREAVFLKLLRHNSIIRFEEDFVVGDYHYIVLDYISMGSLFDVLKANGAFTLSSVKRYAQPLMEVLAFLKKNGLVHGDLKLENILVKDHHTAAIRLADFGGSFFDNEPPDHIFGTPGYQAPEVLLALPFGTAVDMWAAGCILAEISVGKRLLPRTNRNEEVAGITKIVGTPPLKMLHAAPDGHRYFHFFGQLTEECLQETPQCCPLKEFLKTRDPLFLDFIRSILCWNPDDRLTPESALMQPWMSAAPAPPPGFHQAPACKINSHLAPSTKAFATLDSNNFTSTTMDPYKLCFLDSDPNNSSILAPDVRSRGSRVLA
ncbi:putative dual specificity tyrosine-phosphorylation-regulated kinase 3 homolog [Lethenteron reissneri]|uniref:putative dual specificity tyrosine-phosphorylation-regulated kinase 3 homolog n=1 Tax=Lethenteron reissneri TaxID=7753 RepID=UPI002AB6C87E|nr:putative dual specificity tyrosine-phosphorylation-regulated kinase 3 homolog [Lethenteron reissneri]